MSLLSKNEDLFSGKLASMPYSIPLKHDAKPFATKPFSIHHVHVKTVKTEIKRQKDIWVITSDLDSPWASPCFIIPKKDGTVRFLTDFRRLNAQLERHPYPIPKIKTLLQGIPKFLMVSSLDMSMVTILQYLTKLLPNAQLLLFHGANLGTYAYQWESP
jgi:hypothetical protein